MTKEEIFESIMRAYLRGVEWAKENQPDLSLRHKAAYDYADKQTSAEGGHNERHS